MVYDGENAEKEIQPLDRDDETEVSLSRGKVKDWKVPWEK